MNRMKLAVIYALLAFLVSALLIGSPNYVDEILNDYLMPVYTMIFVLAAYPGASVFGFGTAGVNGEVFSVLFWTFLGGCVGYVVGAKRSVSEHRQ